MTKSKRFWISMIVLAFLMTTAIFAISKSLEATAIAALANIMVIGGIYLWGETKRPSKHNITGDLDKGWECPRCNTIHSPYVQKCDCLSPTSITFATSNDSINEQEEQA